MWIWIFFKAILLFLPFLKARVFLFLLMATILVYWFFLLFIDIYVFVLGWLMSSPFTLYEDSMTLALMMTLSATNIVRLCLTFCFKGLLFYKLFLVWDLLICIKLAELIIFRSWFFFNLKFILSIRVFDNSCISTGGQQSGRVGFGPKTPMRSYLRVIYAQF